MHQNTAMQEVDFSLLSPQRITWEQGENTKTVQIQLLPDTTPEFIESVTVRLGNPVGLEIDATEFASQGTINILDATILRKEVVSSSFDIGSK